MGPIKTIAAAACAALLLTSPAASAQTTQDRLTNVTFSGPVSIPGKTLPAGTYVFRLADSPSDRHIVQIFDKDQQQILATLLAVPADRTEAEGDPVITFKETPSDRPPAVRYWYYAGERAGNEFVYPKNQAMMIAQASGESVMSMDTESSDVSSWKGTPSRVGANASSTSTSTTTADTTTASQTAAGTSGSQSTMTSQPTTTAQSQPTTAQPTTAPDQPQTTPTTAPTTTTPSTTAERAASQPTTAQPTTTPETERPVGTSGRSEGELPKTASELPTVGLIGGFAIAGALLLRARRRALV